MHNSSPFIAKLSSESSPGQSLLPVDLSSPVLQNSIRDTMSEFRCSGAHLNLQEAETGRSLRVPSQPRLPARLKNQQETRHYTCLFCSVSLNVHFILVLLKKESCFMQHGPVPTMWSIINKSMLSEVIIFIKGLCTAIQIICFVFLLFETRSYWVTQCGLKLSNPPDRHDSTSSQTTLRYIGFRGWECSLGGRVLA